MEIRILKTLEEKVDMLPEETQEVIKFFSRTNIEWRTYFVALIDQKVVGLVSIVEESYRHPCSIGIGFISTHNDYRKRGISKAFVQRLFEYARENKKNICNTRYEPEGQLYLRHNMQKAAEQYPDVKLYEYE